MSERLTDRDLLASQPADGDLLHVVDISDTTDSPDGTSKKVAYSSLAPDSSTTVKGKVELATDAEANTNTDTVRAVTPSNGQSLVSGAATVASSKGTPVDADYLPIVDSAASNVLKKLTWANLKATLLTWLRTPLVFPVNTPRGFLINGKIVPSVASNNLTVAIKTLAGTDPSSTDPVYVRIGDTVRTISAALSVTKNAGTNWFNSGSSELATKEVDYFVYLGYNATDGVVIGFSRIPGANQYSDFSTTTTNEKYCAISTITNAASTDYYENIGRFAATLGVSATYLWTVPTFTAANLVQRPIYETRWLSWTSVLGDTGGSAPTFTERFISRYKISGDLLKFNICWNNTSGGTAGTGASALTATLPFDISTNVFNAVATRTSIGNGASYESTGTQASVNMQGLQTDSTKMVFYKPAAGTSIIGTELDQASRFLSGLGEYEI